MPTWTFSRTIRATGERVESPAVTIPAVLPSTLTAVVDIGSDLFDPAVTLDAGFEWAPAGTSDWRPLAFITQVGDPSIALLPAPQQAALQPRIRVGTKALEPIIGQQLRGFLQVTAGTPSVGVAVTVS